MKNLRQIIRGELEKEIAGDAFQSGRMGMVNITADEEPGILKRHKNVCRFCGSHRHITKNCPMLYDSGLKERIDPRDYSELRDIIRVEIASVMFDLFKRRRMWI